MSFRPSLPASSRRRLSRPVRTAAPPSSGALRPRVASAFALRLALLFVLFCTAPAVVGAQVPIPPAEEMLPQGGPAADRAESAPAEGGEAGEGSALDPRTSPSEPLPPPDEGDRTSAQREAEGETESRQGASSGGGRRRLRVGTKHIPPFAIRDQDGSWSGISIELWQDLATELDLHYELQEVTLDEMIEGLQNGSLDVAVAAITVTPEREELIDFTHPFHNAGLGIAVVPDSGWDWMAVFRSFLNKGVLTTVLTLGLVLMGVGVLTWLLERRKNSEQFGGTPAHGLGAGFWWAAVTMTTVGYGDKAPVTLAGRLLGLLWMFTGVVMISVFTATMTSSLTVASLGSPIEGAADLPKVRAATLQGSTSEEYLRQNGVQVRTTPTLEEALTLLADDDVEAVVYDEPILRYRVVQGDSSIRILPEVFRQGDYAFGLPQGSPLRERLNRVMLRQLRSSGWRSLLNRYLGE